MFLKRLISIPVWLAVFFVSSFIVFFCLGLIFGINLDGKFVVGERAAYVRIMKAMESGEAKTIGDVIITPAKEWTPERPVNYIWPRVKKDLQVAAYDRGAGNKSIAVSQ